MKKNCQNLKLFRLKNKKIKLLSVLLVIFYCLDLPAASRMRVYLTKSHKLKVLLNRLPSKGNIYIKLFERMLTSHQLGLVLQNVVNFPMFWPIVEISSDAKLLGGAKG